jgi:hypothetical protein
MMTTAPKSTSNAAIDFQMAESILDRLGYVLDDLSLKYGDVCICNGDISHQLYYSSTANSANIVGYVRVENGIYYVKWDNYKTAEQAALELIDRELVEKTRLAIESDRNSSIEYF